MPIKIVDLAAETAPSDDDLIVIRDNLTSTTRKVTRTALFLNPPIPAGAITEAMLANGAVSKIKLGEDAKISVRITVAASPSTITPDMDDFDIFAATGLNTGVTLANHTGAPVNGQGIMFRLKDNGTARSISYGSEYRAIGVTLPTATVANKMTYLAGRWNEEALKLDILSVAREA